MGRPVIDRAARSLTAVGVVVSPERLPCYRAEVDVSTVRGSIPDRPAATPNQVRPLHARWLGRVPYRTAWDLQHRLVAERAADALPDQLLLLEHPAVLTLGRNSAMEHVLAPPPLLAERGIEVIRVERGGEVTYHGPGQLVAYPIVALESRGLLLRPLVRALEEALADTCASFGVVAGRREGRPGCWCDPDGPRPRKIGALGIRVERGVSYHGIALNVSVDLRDFELIDPCGMPGLTSTSIAREARWDPAGADPRSDGDPTMDPRTTDVERAARAFAPALAARFGAELVWDATV